MKMSVVIVTQGYCVSVTRAPHASEVVLVSER